MTLRRTTLAVRFSVLSICTLAATGPAVFGQIAAEPTNMTKQQRLVRMTSFSGRELELELVRLETLANINDEVREHLQRVGAPVSIAVSENRVANKKVTTTVLRNFPDPLVSEALAKSLESQVNKAAASRYQQDVVARRKFFDAAYSDLLIGMLDQQVYLTDEQARQIAKRLEQAEWFPYTHPGLHQYDWSWGITPPAEFLAMKLPELSKIQRSAWSTRKVLLEPLPMHESLQADFEEFKTRCQKAIAFKTTILKEQYQLSDTAVRRLALAGKGVTENLAAKWRDAWQRRTNQLSGTWTTENRELTRYTDLFDLIESQSGWHRRVISVLNAKQKKTFNKRLADRAKRSHDAAWRCWVATYSLRIGFTAKQEIDLFNLVMSKLTLNPKGSRACHANIRRLGTIQLAELEKVLGKTHAADLDQRTIATWRKFATEEAQQRK